VKFSDSGERICDHDECLLLATHTLVWTAQKFFCLPHAQHAIHVSGAIGFPTPQVTFREMTIEEMVPALKKD
jgi:hypothetical protein